MARNIVLVWSQFILECGLRMASNDSDHDIQCDKGDDQPADDKAGLVEGALQPLVLSFLSFSLKVHQEVRIICFVLIKLCSGVLG